MKNFKSIVFIILLLVFLTNVLNINLIPKLNIENMENMEKSDLSGLNEEKVTSEITKKTPDDLNNSSVLNELNYSSDSDTSDSDTSDSENKNDKRDTCDIYYKNGVKKSDIPKGEEHLYILKSKIVPPVCPACPQYPVNNTSNSVHKCPPCPPCERCPEQKFDCVKVNNSKYSKYSNVDLENNGLNHVDINSVGLNNNYGLVNNNRENRRLNNYNEINRNSLQSNKNIMRDRRELGLESINSRDVDVSKLNLVNSNVSTSENEPRPVLSNFSKFGM